MIIQTEKDSLKDAYKKCRIDSVLYDCCQNGLQEKIEYIIEQNYYINDDFNSSLIAIAVENKQKDIVYFLIEKADLYNGNKEMIIQNAVGACFDMDNVELLSSLLHKYPNGEYVSEIPRFFTHACHHGSINVIKFIADHEQYKEEINQFYSFGRAVENKMWDVAAIFIFEMKVSEDYMRWYENTTEIIEMFEKRRFSDKLEEDLIEKQTGKKLKI